MAYRGNDAYEQARINALIAETDAKRSLEAALAATYPFIPQTTRVKNVEDINPMRGYREPIEGNGKYTDQDSPDYAAQFDKFNAPVDLFSGINNNDVDIPTSTTNARRPRTVAAGYARRRYPNGKDGKPGEEYGILTVVFRDGTIWNYDNDGAKGGVTEGQWLNFRASVSKGRPWINEKKFGEGREADAAFIDPQIKAKIYEVAREYQLQNASVRKYRAPDQSKKTKARVQRVGKMSAKRAQTQFRGPVPKKGGTNPSTGGKNPNQ
jgi:hypothetical protein